MKLKALTTAALTMVMAVSKTFVLRSLPSSFGAKLTGRFDPGHVAIFCTMTKRNVTLCLAILAIHLVAPLVAAAESLIHGYPGKRSYVAGEELTFHFSTDLAEVDLEIARVGAERQVVWNGNGIRARKHPVPKNASSHGCDWPAASIIKVPESWASGCYEALARSGETQG
ncbi:MAG: hypothetical protein CMO73_13345, partial [Verrucomicrobiales bacterium]|nr:hypothetical protein [Verrucomicrobiales bacterium]